MQSETSPSFYSHLCQRFRSLIWSCLDADLTRSAVFHAERYFAMDRTNHESRHLYATALLREGQTYSALNLVNGAHDEQCTGCMEVKAKCSTALGRHRQARETLENTLRDTNYVSSASTSTRISHPFPEEAALRCRSGTSALKGNLPEKASRSFQDALAINPYLWEAFEGLCSLGSFTDVDEIFPPRPPPVKRGPPEEAPTKSVPIVTGIGFFTPDTGNGGNLFRSWKPEIAQPQPFRIAPPLNPRDSITSSDLSFFPAENSFQVHRTTRSQPTNIANQNVSRSLSSADEGGPVTKKLRSTSKQSSETLKTKPSKASLDDPLKKQTTSSRTNTTTGKSNALPTTTTHLPTRRSTRLLSGTGTKPPSKTSTRDRRRPATHTRKGSVESEKEENSTPSGEVAYSTSPPSATVPLSPRSEVSPSPSNWTSAQEQLAQEEYENELAEQYLYDLTRRFARAARYLAVYDCQKCLDELEQLPHVQQHSSTVIAMVGKAHYEKQNFAAADRAFKTLRKEDPYRQWDMEVYSSLLWHLQRSVELSFLAQELLNINPQSPQAWITIGNLFSLQKERQQALTCFRRASQLDPTCAYAHTLSGHESIDEDLDKAINFFQSALRADARHYNAWYGLGTCYLRMSKIRLAEYHFRKAAEIHPKNAVLLGCVGMVSDEPFMSISYESDYFADLSAPFQKNFSNAFHFAQAVERRGDREAALALFDEAVRLAPDNALVRYRRAKIYISMRKYHAAVDDLEFLRSSTPEESNVIFQLAKVYRLLGNVLKSAQTLALARDISPKSMGKIKKLLDTVKDEGDDKMDEG